jgi:hypothetical protein
MPNLYKSDEQEPNAEPKCDLWDQILIDFGPLTPGGHLGFFNK